ncbi:CAAX protease self-immunity [Reichenbachiella faecimaris]|uniref:CAAX protease self-immunity n=1 Tax=Reichenbachiella faecimaris TaxID=692418 RepID=A0A1W2GHA9_REIFA|nr:CPBP family intramembrane glutamic endopeptidase [Reichenbachiella faecimaris]SMD36040.1 CAAX protease self-immunity [Reichenbachiella faecimaris]
MSFREKKKVYNLLEILVLLIIPLPILDLNAIYMILVLLIVGFSKKFRNEKWSEYGFNTVTIDKLIIASSIGVLMGFFDSFLIEPVISKQFGTPDVSGYQQLMSSLSGFFVVLIIGWLVGGMFEEFFFRGYLFNRLKMIIVHPLAHKWISVISTSLVFSTAHWYQGIGGVIGTFYFSILVGMLYFYFKNTWCLVLVHGFFNTVGILKLYLT